MDSLDSAPAARRRRLPWRWSLWRHDPSTVAIVLAVEAAALVATVLVVSSGFAGTAAPVSAGGHSAPLVAVMVTVVAVAQAEFDRFALRARRMIFADSHGFEFLSVWTFGAPLLLPAAYYLPVILIVHFHSWWRIARVRKPLHRSVFTLATVVLAAHCAHLLLGILGGGEPSAVLGMPAIAGWVPVVVVAMLAYAVVNQMLVVLVIWSSNPTAARSVLWGTGEDYLLELVTLSLGAIAAVLVAANPALLVLLPAPLLLVQRTVVLRQLSQAIQLDPKTGLLTVAALRSRAERLLGGSRAPLGLRRRGARSPIGVLMCDLDHFKEINDRFGHLAGDAVLCRIADVLRGGVDDGDLVARFGGEEFLVLLVRPRADRDAEQVVAEAAERLRALVSGTQIAVETPDGSLDLGRVTVSIGAVVMPPDEVVADLDTFIAAADVAVYEAKRAGRDRVRLVPPPRPPHLLIKA